MAQRINEADAAITHNEQGEASQAFPFLSSRPHRWGDILVEQQQLPSGEHVVPPLTEHTLLFFLGSPLRMAQQRDGKRDERLLTPGDIIVAPAQLPSTCSWKEPLTVLQIRLEQTYLQQVAAQIDYPVGSRIEILNRFSTRDPQLEQIALQFRSELVSHEFGERIYIESLTNILAVHLLRRYTGSNGLFLSSEHIVSKKMLQPVIDYIQAYLQDDVSLDALAEVAQVSPFHFARSFKQAIGMAPHQYIIQQRLERAKQLLLTTDLSVTEVAVSVGFYDQGHLARHMRRLLGITPRMLQQSKNIR